MKKVLFCLKMPHGTYCGGVASMVNSYIAKSDVFAEYAVMPELFDYDAPASCEKLPSKISNVMYGFLQRYAILKRLRHGDIAGVHIHTSCQFLYLKDIWLAKQTKQHRNVPVYITVHVGAAETVFQRIGFIGYQTIKWINRYVDRVIFLSDGIRKEFEGRGMYPEKGITLRNFHDLADVPLENEIQPVARLHLLFVGAIHRDKGILELLTALTRISELDIHLDVCGLLTDQTIQEQFEGLVAQLGDRVTLYGYVTGEQKTALYKRADVLILPSYHEGFPLVILEALASGCAVISTPVGATPEILNESNAMWVRIKSSQDVKDAVEKLYTNPELLQKLQGNNRLLSAEFSLEKHIQSLCEIYDA